MTRHFQLAIYKRSLTIASSIISVFNLLMFNAPTIFGMVPQAQGPVVHGVPGGTAQQGVVAALEGGERICENITVPMCRGIGYSLTSMPNRFNHDTQEEAGLVVQQFWHLVEKGCSPHLRFFLCSMYAPICMPNYYRSLPACREVCTTVRDGCMPVLVQYGFAWPDQMDCQHFPAHGDKYQLCMDLKVAESASHHMPANKPGQGASGSDTDLQTERRSTISAATGHLASPPSHFLAAPSFSPSLSPVDTACSCRCRQPLIIIDNVTSRHYDHVTFGGVSNCALPCDGLYFRDAHERRFAQFWISLWSILCLCSTLVTSLTFLVDRGRFVYPEKPIVYMSVCFLAVGVSYTLPLALGRGVIACEPYVSANDVGTKMLLRRDVDMTPSSSSTSSSSSLCMLTFVLSYLFGMAASAWWVVLAVTWFMAAGLGWGGEAIARYAPYFHVIGWGLPALQTVAVLLFSAIDGDALSGICYVGQQDTRHLLVFLIGPLSVYLSVGVAVLVAGFTALFRVRRALRDQGAARVKTEKLERLMLRIGVFSVLYTVPATIVLLCHVYEQHWRAHWDRAHTCDCQGSSRIPQQQSQSTSGSTSGIDRPDFSIYMLKYFMSVVVGITSGAWIWSGKTIDSWRSCCDVLCCRHSHSVGRTPSIREDDMLKPSSRLSGGALIGAASGVHGAFVTGPTGVSLSVAARAGGGLPAGVNYDYAKNNYYSQVLRCSGSGGALDGVLGGNVGASPRALYGVREGGVVGGTGGGVNGVEGGGAVCGIHAGGGRINVGIAPLSD